MALHMLGYGSHWGVLQHRGTHLSPSVQSSIAARPCGVDKRCRVGLSGAVKVRSSNGASNNGSNGTDSNGDQHGRCKGPYPANEHECKEHCRTPDGELKDICAWDGKDLPRHHTSRRGVSNQVQLSTYGDCIGNNLADLRRFLQTEIKDAVGSIHLLPVFPSSGDRGFAPIRYDQVDDRLGTWQDVQALGDNYQLCLEYMVNHISPQSHQYQDYVANGDNSQFRNMFVKWKDIWPKGAPSADELQKVRTRKPAPPVLGVHMADGSVVPLWCTFSDQQIDINPFSEEGWKFTEASLRSLCERGARLIRLDAFGYVTKQAGTSCFMQEPEVWDLLSRIKEMVKPYGVQLLCEVHEDFNLNIELARHGYWVYDFALPLLMLHAMRFKTAGPLKHWLSICPRRQITTLDTHDGMGVDDVAGLAPLVDVPELEHCILSHGGTINYKHFYVPGGEFESEAAETIDQRDGVEVKGGGFEQQCRKSKCTLKDVQEFLQPDCMQGCYKSVPHQYNETYYSAMDEDPKKYLMARAIQFFTPGVPMVYYVGLLAGTNDYELLKKGSIRDINRHYYSLEEARAATRRPVVQALLQLCTFRNTHPAFKGRVFIDGNMPDHQLHVRWYSGTQHLAVLQADFQTLDFSISHTPYETSADNSGDLSLDVASVFSIDALDMPTRAAIRKQLAKAMQTPNDGSGFSSKMPVQSEDHKIGSGADNRFKLQLASFNTPSPMDTAVQPDADNQEGLSMAQELECRQMARSMTPSEAAAEGVTDARAFVDELLSDGDSQNDSSARNGSIGENSDGNQQQQKQQNTTASGSNGNSNADGNDHAKHSIQLEGAAAAAAANISEEGSLDASSPPAVNVPSESEVDENTAMIEESLEVLDLSWAWKMAHQPAAQVAAAG